MYEFRGSNHTTHVMLEVLWSGFVFSPQKVYLWGSIFQKKRLDRVVGALGGILSSVSGLMCLAGVSVCLCASEHVVRLGLVLSLCVCSYLSS